jgi:hypothetical protein
MQITVSMSAFVEAALTTLVTDPVLRNEGSPAVTDSTTQEQAGSLRSSTNGTDG